MTAASCAVALPIPAAASYRYAVPTALADRVRPGARVVVPVRSREMVGIVLSLEAEGTDLRPVLLAPDPEPTVPPALLSLAEWVGRYYGSPTGLALRAMLPGALWGRSQLVATLVDPARAPGGASRDLVEALDRAGGRAPAAGLQRRLRRPVWDLLQRLARTGAIALETQGPRLGPGGGREQVVRLTTPLPTLLERQERFGRAERQREAYEVVDGMGGEAAVRHLVRQLGFSRAVVRGLVERGVASIEEQHRMRDPFADVVGEEPPEPSGVQREVVGALAALDPGSGALLYGVTGSGKTLVYLQAVRREVDAGRGAIVLVPEIALTPQTIARVKGVFRGDVAVLHSGLSDGERVDAWRSLARGDRRVAVGARSAVFAPVERLGVIVLDEEHDASYKHGEAPRYHARDVAMRRAKLEGARVVMGTATPSLETWAARTRVRVLQLPTRATAHPLPPVQLVDMRSAARVEEARAVPWSQALDDGVRAALAGGHQALLLLNRRGYASFRQCRGCGHVWQCPACSIALTVHRSPPRLRCHYCGHDEAVAPTCPQCERTVHRARGTGTQSLERWLSERFPRARLARMDADTTSAKWSHQRILDAVGRREIDVLFGTQMVAKGLDFPGVTLVGVVDADTGLHLPDFRSAERVFQLIAQVAGRAGRGPAGGRVLVQTWTPAHHALRAAAGHDFEGFAAQELEARRSPPYPPHVGLINVVASGPDERRVGRAAADLAAWFAGLRAARGLDALELVGPAPAPLARIQRRWRWHLVVRCADRRALGRVLRYAAARAPHVRGGPVRISFDRDPVSLL